MGYGACPGERGIGGGILFLHWTLAQAVVVGAVPKWWLPFCTAVYYRLERGRRRRVVASGAA